MPNVGQASSHIVYDTVKMIWTVPLCQWMLGQAAVACYQRKELSYLQINHSLQI